MRLGERQLNGAGFTTLPHSASVHSRIGRVHVREYAECGPDQK